MTRLPRTREFLSRQTERTMRAYSLAYRQSCYHRGSNYCFVDRSSTLVLWRNGCEAVRPFAMSFV
ncbi:MAG: hypothetical protein J7642_09230 [Cyanobacteria bacterium SBC]|nr:hypothetical protein [Cyanobacteria bacterium SBC]